MTPESCRALRALRALNYWSLSQSPGRRVVAYATTSCVERQLGRVCRCGELTTVGEVDLSVCSAGENTQQGRALVLASRTARDQGSRSDGAPRRCRVFAVLICFRGRPTNSVSAGHNSLFTIKICMRNSGKFYLFARRIGLRGRVAQPRRRHCPVEVAVPRSWAEKGSNPVRPMAAGASFPVRLRHAGQGIRSLAFTSTESKCLCLTPCCRT
jgi:hypothetical protein